MKLIKLLWAPLLVLMAIPLLAGTPDAAERHGLRVTRDLAYKSVNGTNLVLDFYHPLERVFDRAPLMIYIHGGGWANGDRYAVFRRDHLGVLKQLNQAGIACASIEYRLTKSGTTVFNSVVDCKDAARFLVQESERLGIDPQRMGAWGGSAGGHLCLMTAMAPDEKFPGDDQLRGQVPVFRCAVAYYPLTSFLDPEGTGGNFRNPQRLIPILGGPIEEKRELAALLSPVTYLSTQSPPVFVIHGDQDAVLSHRGSVAFEREAAARGARARLLVVEGAGHGLRGEAIAPPLEEVTSQAMSFIRTNLLVELKPAPAASAALTK